MARSWLSASRSRGHSQEQAVLLCPDGQRSSADAIGQRTRAVGRRLRLCGSAVALLSLWCCPSTPPPAPTARPFDDVRRLAIIVSGESALSVLGHRAETRRIIH